MQIERHKTQGSGVEGHALLENTKITAHCCTTMDKTLELTKKIPYIQKQ